METWQILKGQEVITSYTNTQDITYNFPANDTDEDIHYTINYTSDTNTTATLPYTVPKCTPTTHCEDEWSITITGGVQPFIQTYSGTGGTPAIVTIKHNGEAVEGLTSNDLELHIGPNGAYDEIFSGLEVFYEGQGMYRIYINKTSEDATCKYVGELLTCTLAPTACTEAKVEFTIKIEEKEEWMTYITGLPETAEPMGLSYEFKLTNCSDHAKRLNFDDFVYESGQLEKETQMYKNIDISTLKVYGISQLPSGYNQDPACLEIVSTNNHEIHLRYIC